MEIQLLNKELLKGLHDKARESERLRMNFDLRTTPEDASQRMLALPTSVATRPNMRARWFSLLHRLNALEVGTKVPIHRHLESSETVVCLEGCQDWVFYEEFSRLASSNERPEVERPNMDAGGPVHDGEVAANESCFVETARFRVCPREGQYGIQVPLGAWHSVVVHEASTIFEGKDGAYGK